MVLWAAEAVGLPGCAQVHSFWLFLVTICPITALDPGSVVAYRALLATALSQEGVVEARAKLRALANVGVVLSGDASAAGP